MYASYPELFPNGRLAYKAIPDNVSSLFNTGSLFENSVGLSGGEGNTLFSITLSRVDQKGYITNSSYNKTNVSAGGQTNIGKLTVGASMSYARSKQIGGFIGQAQSFYHSGGAHLQWPGTGILQDGLHKTKLVTKLVLMMVNIPTLYLLHTTM
jgi:hypothetical protein